MNFKKIIFFVLYYLIVLVYTRTTYKALILWNMLFESEIDGNVTTKSTQIALNSN